MLKSPRTTSVAASRSGHGSLASTSDSSLRRDTILTNVARNGTNILDMKD
jgi:hypothetical protein